MIWRYPQLYVRKRDAALVVMRLFDTVSSLIQTSALHEYRFPPELLPTQFYFRAYCIWFGAFFGCVGSHPTVKSKSWPYNVPGSGLDCQYSALCPVEALPVFLLRIA